jgi:hypothetical protein
MQTCRHCGQMHGVRCPFVKVIEYYETGAVKRVEFIDVPAPAPQPHYMHRYDYSHVLDRPSITLPFDPFNRNGAVD